MKKILIVGAGPGGLAAGLILSARGFDVEIFEKNETPGGRCRRVELGNYRFDLGPTFLMYIDALSNIFCSAGFELQDEVVLKRLDPLYRLIFSDSDLTLRADTEANAELYEAQWKGAGKAYKKWLIEQDKKFNAFRPIMEKPFPSVLSGLRFAVLKALPYLHPFQSVYTRLKSYFPNETFIHSLSFQAKYLGMASIQAPSVFTMLSYLEHARGLYHVEGGINRIHEKMAELIERKGGKIRYNAPVKEIIVENGRARGVRLEDDSEIRGDAVILNADFAYAMTHLIRPSNLKRWAPEIVVKKKYSASTVMVYLGLDAKYDFNHHSIVFSKDYNAYLRALMNNEVAEDISYYMHNPGGIDDTNAPKGHSTLYLLSPVPNLSSGVDWEREAKRIRDHIIDDIESRFSVDIRSHVKAEKIYTPLDWKESENVHLGAVFNLTHGFDQLLHKRPHNEFEDIGQLYLVGGGTHPGSGLPTIYQSAIIVCGLPFFAKP